MSACATRQGREWGVRADAWYDADLGKYRVNLFDGAVVLIEKERFHDSYMRVSSALPNREAQP